VENAVLSTYLNFKIVASDLNKSLARIKAEKPVAREVDYYLSNIAKVKSVEDFLKNDRLFRFAMKAMGLNDMSFAKGMIRKVLNEGVDHPNAMANKFQDQRYKEFAKVFNFKQFGAATTAFEAARGGVVEKYVRQTLEENSGAANEGVRLALYFQRKAPGLTTAYSILADKALLKVTQVALNLPASMSNSDIDTQARMIDGKLKIADLKSPDKLEKFLQRFATLYDLANDTSSSQVASLFMQSREGLSADMIMSLQKLRR
jgi:hypothetical protein